MWTVDHSSQLAIIIMGISSCCRFLSGKQVMHFAFFRDLAFFCESTRVVLFRNLDISLPAHRSHHEKLQNVRKSSFACSPHVVVIPSILETRLQYIFRYMYVDGLAEVAREEGHIIHERESSFTPPSLCDSFLMYTFQNSSQFSAPRRYRIVYHANYVTYAKRAIEHAFGTPGVRVHSLPIVKYRAAATLGEEIAVQGALVSCDDSSSGDGRSRWRFELAAASDPSRVFVTAEATVSWPGSAAMPPGVAVGKLPSAEPTTTGTELLQPLPEAFTDSPKTLKVVVWSDDLDGGRNLSIRAVLNYFERIRTLSLGRGKDGELGLMRLHREGVSVVVRFFFSSYVLGGVL